MTVTSCCEHRLGGFERPRRGDPAERGAADADRGERRSAGSGAPGAGTVSNCPPSTVRLAASSQPPAAGARKRRAAPCRSVLLPEAKTKSRTRSSGLLPSTGPGGGWASSPSPTWRSTCTGELSGTLAQPAARGHGQRAPPAAVTSRRLTGRPAVARGRRRLRPPPVAAHWLRRGRMRPLVAPAAGCDGDGPAARRGRHRHRAGRRRRRPASGPSGSGLDSTGAADGRAATSAGTPPPARARPRPAASRRAGGRPRPRSTGPGRCRRCAGPATPRPARTG